MLNRLKFFLLIPFCFFLANCSRSKEIPDGYIIMWVNSCWTLDYDLENGCGIGRVDDVSDVGWTDNYIFAISE